MILVGLGGLCGIAAFVCWLIVLIDAFKNEIWKGIVGLICGFYLLYYAIVEYQADNKWLIVAIWLLGGVVGSALMMAGGAASFPRGAGPLVR